MGFSSYTSYDDTEIGNYYISYGESYSGYEDAIRYHVNVMNFDDFDYIDEDVECTFETKEDAYKKYLETCEKYRNLVYGKPENL